MNKTTYNRWCDVINRRSKTWSKSEINSFKNLLNRRKWSDNTDRDSKLYDMQYDMILKRDYLNITEDHSKQGIDYLRTLAFKRDGTPRAFKDYPFNSKQLEIIRRFKKFTFRGYLEVGEITGESRDYGHWVIIYRVHSKQGEYFDYIPIYQGLPWIVKLDAHGYYYKQSLPSPLKIKQVEDIFKVPRLETEEIDSCFKAIDSLFCDSSGFGGPYEAALTASALQEHIGKMLTETDNLYAAITDSGQFQVYITLFKRITGSKLYEDF